MSITDTLCFADFDPVTGPPTVDGNTGIEDDGVSTFEPEPGYVLGSRLVYNNGALLPPVIFQGVKNGNFLNLAFFCRFDLTFDNSDVIVIALRPKLSDPTQTTARRIDIFPVYDAFGADGPPGTTGDDHPPTDTSVDYHIRNNHSARVESHYRGQTGATPWTIYTPANITVRSRSWLPPVADLTKANGEQTLTPGGDFNVLNVTPFPPGGGVFSTHGGIYRYERTDTTLNKFVNVTGFTASNTVPDGWPVSIPEAAWSIEVQLPLKKAGADGGGPDWIDIEDKFGLYFSVIRTGATPASSDGTTRFVGGFFNTQHLFPVGSGHYVEGLLGPSTLIGSDWYGTGLIPALQSPPGSNLGIGVRFLGGASGVGVRSTTDPPGTAPCTLIRVSTDTGPGENQLVAQVENTDASAALKVSAEFRFANWGLGPSGFHNWDPASLHGATPDFPFVDVPGAGTAEIKHTWPKSAVPIEYNAFQHQCVWVQLTSTTGVNFTQSSVRRNMDFHPLSELSRPATISGVGYERPPKKKHQFLLMTHVRRIEARRFQGQQNLQARQTSASVLPPVSGKKMVYWIWIVLGYRRTGKTLKIGKREFEILDESPGAFGSIGLHRGLNDVFTYQMSGGGIQHLGGNVHALTVPHNGSVEINTRIAAGPPPPKPPRCKPGSDKWKEWIEELKRFFQH